MGSTFRSVDEVARVLVRDLQGDSTHIAPNDRFPFPKTLCDRQPKAFPQGLLKDNVCAPLQRIDRSMDVSRQEQDFDVRVISGCDASRSPPWGTTFRVSFDL